MTVNTTQPAQPTQIQRAYHVSGNSVTPTSESEESIFHDPRGILFIWEEPKQHAKYIMGCDPTVGITGWGRSSRIPSDRRTDNGAIEIFRVDALKMRSEERRVGKESRSRWA